MIESHEINKRGAAHAGLGISVASSISQGARDHQEDACGHWFDAGKTRLFAVVADGAGGHGGGAEASQAAITSAAKTWQKSTLSALAQPSEFLANWMKNAHLAVNEASAKIQRSARSVVVACLTDGSSVHWVHAGDCRLMRFRDGKLVERTRDDSVVQVLFERGDITEEEMGNHPDQSRLLQSLGGEAPPTPRPGSAQLASGDSLILCSDGFWEHLKPAELEKLIATPTSKRQHALDQAVAEAVRRGGAKSDNTTALMIHCDGDNTSSFLSSALWGLLIVLAVLAGAAAAFWIYRYEEENAAGKTPSASWPGHPARSPSPDMKGPDLLPSSATPLPESHKNVIVNPLPQELQSPGRDSQEPGKDSTDNPSQPQQKP